mgnify:CR=1 FL=1
MIAIITGDLVGSRHVMRQDRWLKPLKKLLREWGPSPGIWDIYRGDSFQIQIDDPADALLTALRIKALIRSIPPDDAEKRNPVLDVRMAIGIGEKNFAARKITESNGPAFVRSGEQYERLRKEKVNLAMSSPWPALDEDLNLCLRLAGITMDAWTVNSAEIAAAVLRQPEQTQQQLGEQLGIEQNTVSDRFRRAHLPEILALEELYRKRINQQRS